MLSISSCCVRLSNKSRLTWRTLPEWTAPAPSSVVERDLLSRPALATVAIFTFQAAWNDFLAPLIFLHNQSLYAMQLGLSLFRGAYNVQWAYLMAASLVVTLPVIIIFFFAQRSFIKGVGFTGTKI